MINVSPIVISLCPCVNVPNMVVSQTLLNALPTIIQYPKITLDLHPLLVKYCAVIIQVIYNLRTRNMPGKNGIVWFMMQCSFKLAN